MRNDKTSTNPNSPFAKDDRPLVPSQDPKTKKWKVHRGSEERGRLIGCDLNSKDEADAVIEREKFFVPRTDSTPVSRTRKTFFFDNVPDEVWERIKKW